MHQHITFDCSGNSGTHHHSSSYFTLPHSTMTIKIPVFFKIIYIIFSFTIVVGNCSDYSYCSGKSDCKSGKCLGGYCVCERHLSKCYSKQFCKYEYDDSGYCHDKLNNKEPCNRANQCILEQCNAGQCGCSNHYNCQRKQYCSTDGTCVAKKMHAEVCRNDVECVSEKCNTRSSNQHCGCSDDNECNGNRYCKPNTKSCERKLKYKKPCSRPIQCKSNVCHGSVRKCGCSNDNECNGNRYCKTSTNSCERKLKYEKPCSRPIQCKSNVCHGSVRKCGCSNDNECNGNRYCKTSTNSCERKLKYEKPCSRPIQCKSNVCHGSVRKCGCSNDNECNGNRYCKTSTNSCERKLKYEKPCSRPIQCKSNVCHGSVRKCGCSNDNECNGNRYCKTSTNSCERKLKYEKPCSRPIQCKSNVCHGSVRKCGCSNHNECNGNRYCKTSTNSCERKLKYEKRCGRPAQCRSNICHSLFGKCGCKANSECPKNSYCNTDMNNNTCIGCHNDVASIWKSCLKKCLEDPNMCLAHHVCTCSRLNGSTYFNWNSRIHDYINKIIENISFFENSIQPTHFNEIKYWQPKAAASYEISTNLTLSDFAKFVTELDKRGCLDTAWSIVFPTDHIIGINMSSIFNKSSQCSPRCTNYKKSNKTDQTCYKNVIYDHNGEMEPTCSKKVHAQTCETPPRVVTAIPPRSWSEWANVSRCHRESNHPASKCYRFEGRHRSSDNSRPSANQDIRKTECNEADQRECDLNCTMSIGRPQKCKDLKLNNDVPQCVLTVHKDVIVNATYNGSQCGETATIFTCTTAGPNHKLCADAIARLQCFEVFMEERKKFCKTVCRDDTKAARMMKFADNKNCKMYHEYSILTSSMCHEQNCSNDCRYTLDNLVDTLMTSSFQLGNQQCNDMTPEPCPANENYIHTTTLEEGKCNHEATDGRMKRDTCLSHWTAWSVCTKKCNIGTRSRTMEVLHGGKCAHVVDSEPCMLNICANHLSGNLCLFLYFNTTEGDKIVTKRIKVSGDNDCIVHMGDQGFVRPSFPTMNKLVDTKDCEDVLYFSVNFPPIFINGIIVALLVMMVIVARQIRQSAAATDLEGIPLEDVPVPAEIETTIESATPRLPACPSVRNVDDQSETMFSRSFTRKSAQSKSIEKVTSPPILSDPFKTESVTTLDLDPSTLSRQDSKSPNTRKSIETEEKTQKSTFTSPSIIKITKTWKLDAIIDKTEGTSTLEQKSKDRITPQQTR